MFHADLYYPGEFIYSNNIHYLVNTMYRLTSFVIVVFIEIDKFTTLTTEFVQLVCLKFDINHLVGIDYGNQFRLLFTVMYYFLNIPYEVVSKFNDKSLNGEKIHFLN